MNYLASDAMLSECGTYRYTLERWWAGYGDAPPCLFVMLNPSTADALEDDPTVRRCVGFADAWGFGRVVVVNLFAFRATEPREMYKAADPFGPLNDEIIRGQADKAGRVVAAWGAHGSFRGRDVAVRAMLDKAGVRMCHLGLTGKGQPRHPLYLKADTKPQPWKLT